MCALALLLSPIHDIYILAMVIVIVCACRCRDELLHFLKVENQEKDRARWFGFCLFLGEVYHQVKVLEDAYLLLLVILFWVLLLLIIKFGLYDAPSSIHVLVNCLLIVLD